MKKFLSATEPEVSTKYRHWPLLWVLTSGFRRDIDEIYLLLGYYAVSSGKPLPTFRYNVSVPSSRAKKLDRQIVAKRR
jgi:hypothetical protein